MKYGVFFFAVAALFGALVEADFINVPYTPPPTPPPRWRFRRQVLNGQISTNANGGSDAQVQLSKAIGTPEHNLIGSVFAAGNTQQGPVTTGGSLAYNNHGHGLDISKQHIPGVRDTFSQSAHANLFNDGTNNVNANAFLSQNKLANGFEFQRNGFGLDYAHKDGHGASLTRSTIPNFGSQLGLDAKANLWTSQDRNTRFDATGSASRWTSGPLSGQNNFGAGLGLTHFFRG